MLNKYRNPKTRYMVECPLCGVKISGWSHMDTEDSLKYHALKKHPVEYTAVRDKEKKKGLSL